MLPYLLLFGLFALQAYRFGFSPPSASRKWMIAAGVILGAGARMADNAVHQRGRGVRGEALRGGAEGALNGLGGLARAAHLRALSEGGSRIGQRGRQLTYAKGSTWARTMLNRAVRRAW